MASPGPERYALYDEEEDCWWFYLTGCSTEHGPRPVLVWTGPSFMRAPEVLPLEEGRRNWWRAPGEPLGRPPDFAMLELLSPPRRVIDHYALNIATDTFPATLTRDEFGEMVDDESEKYDRRISALYQPVYTETEAARVPVEGPWLVLEGQPPPEDGLTWNAKMPAVLRTAVEYEHLFPGHLAGFREALVARLHALENVDAYGTGSGPVSVFLKVEVDRLEQVVFEAPSKARGMKGTRLRERSLITRQLQIPAARAIFGENRAEAVAAWNEKMDEIVGYVAGLVAHPCPTCGGRAWVEPPKEGDA